MNQYTVCTGKVFSIKNFNFVTITGNLIPHADIVFISKDFARYKGCANKEDAARFFVSLLKDGLVLNSCGSTVKADFIDIISYLTTSTLILHILILSYH